MNTTKNTTAFKDKSARRFITPSLTLSAAALGVSAAHGAVVVSDFADVTTTGGTRIGFAFNTSTGIVTPRVGSGDTRIDFQSNFYFSKFGFWNGAYVDRGSFLSAIASTPFQSGDTVDASGNLQSEFFTPQSNLTDAYFGVGMTSGSDVHYGWIKVSTGPDAGGQGPVSITIHSAALETTPNVGITIPSAVPEPSSVLLLGLAAGAGAFRRRRQAA
jgi:hypothetical protein